MTIPAAAMPRTVFWLAAVAACAVLAIFGAEFADLRVLHYLFKPLATLLIAAMAWRMPVAEPAYRRAVLAGLLLSLLGDVFLMLPGDWFAFGLGSFLLAHLCYLRALRLRGRWFLPVWPLLAYAAVAGAVLLRLWPHLPAALQIPVVVYVAALAAMAAQAAAVWRTLGSRATSLAAWGGACFVISDAVLALDRFAMTIPWASVWILATYWLAQWSIARSVAEGTRGGWRDRAA